MATAEPVRWDPMSPRLPQSVAGVLGLFLGSCVGAEPRTEPVDAPGADVAEEVHDDAPGATTGDAGLCAGLGSVECACETNADCPSGYCVPSPEGPRCTDVCIDACPDQWACTRVTNTGTDETWLCLPELTHACQPCTSDADCAGQSARPGMCVALGESDGSFCALPCDGSGTCPPGYACSAATSAEVAVCLPGSGSCTCSAWGVSQGAATPCARSGPHGTCHGWRRCGPEGLTDCDAAVPSEEVCNGLDDDCDGEKDRTCDVEGGCVDACGPPGPCAEDGAPCDDGDACTFGDACSSGQCRGAESACPACAVCDGAGGCLAPAGGCLIAEECTSAGSTAPGEPCLGCRPELSVSAWSPVQDGTACDDGHPCTTGDTCEAGTCGGAPVTCLACQACGAGGACVALTGWCVIEGACRAAGERSGPGSCLACVPEVSNDSWTAVSAWACDDGDACTVADTCSEGSCAGAPKSCDGLSGACAAGVCVDGACQAVPVAGPCEDGSACTIGDVCLDGSCVGGASAPCDDGMACTDDGCDPAQGCTSTPNVAPCDDGEPCTTGDACSGGACLPGPAADCDDGSTCTADWCEPGVGCQHLGECCGTLGAACPEDFDCTDKGTCETFDEVFVPAGPFWRGCDVESPDLWFCLLDTRPVHQVVLPAFAIDRTEVRWSQWIACVEAGVCLALPGMDEYGKWSNPVEGVTREQAAAFCAWKGKRLPTEAEWEKAAAGGCETIAGDCRLDRRKYPWGDEPPTCAVANVVTAGKCSPFFGDKPKSLEVWGRPEGASPYGALDMAGNVKEWVQDWYKGDYYCKGPLATCDDACYTCEKKGPWQPVWPSPPGPSTGTVRVARGGSYYSGQDLLVVWTREPVPPDKADLTGYGFRCARSLP